MSIFRRQQGPAQQGWIAIQACVSRTLVERMAKGPDAVISEEDAWMLADHVADDLMSLNPAIPPEHWVQNPRG